MSVRAQALGSIVRLLAAACVGLLLVDRAVGWLERAHVAAEPGVLVEDWRLGWTNRPGYRSELYRTDARGLRNAEIPADAPRDEVRVLVVGDSRIFGSGVDDGQVFTAQLEQSLRAAGHAVRVLNGGVNNYATVQAAQRAALLLEALEPDLVLLFASPGWTLRPGPRAGEWTRVGDQLVPADVVAGWPAVLAPLPALAHRALGHLHLYARHRASLRKGGALAGEVAHFVLSLAEPVDAARPFLASTTAALEALAAAAEASGTEVRAALLPETFQISRSVWERYLLEHAASGAPPVGTDPIEPMVALQRLVEGAGIEAWSFYEEIAVFMRDVDRYYQDDEAHWTAAGHAAFAETLARRLGEGGLLAGLAERRARRPR